MWESKSSITAVLAFHSDLGQGGWTGTPLLPIPLAGLATVLGQGPGAQGHSLRALPHAPCRPGWCRAQRQLRVGPQPASAARLHGPQGLDRQMCVPADRLLGAHAPCPRCIARDGPSPFGPPADPQAGGVPRTLGLGAWVGGKLVPQWEMGTWGRTPELGPMSVWPSRSVCAQASRREQL